MFVIKFESILNKLYETAIIAHEGNIKLAFEKIITIANELKNLFSEIIKNQICVATYEKYVCLENNKYKIISGDGINEDDNSLVLELELML